MDFTKYIYDSWLRQRIFSVTFPGVKKKALIEDKLFEGSTEEVKRLNKQARRELRQKEREKYARRHGLR